MNLPRVFFFLTGLGIIAAGCAAADDDVSSSNDAFSTTTTACTADSELDREDTVAITTREGAFVTLTSRPTLPASANCGTSGGLLVHYYDAHGFFGAAQQLQTHVAVTTHGTDGKQKTRSQKVMLARASDGFDGVFCGVATTELVDIAEVAFSDGSKWDSNGSKNYVARFSDQRLTAAFTTGVGAEVEVDAVVSWPSGANCVQPGFAIYYQDKLHHFGNAPSLHAVALLRQHLGANNVTKTIDVDLVRGERWYIGIACGTLWGEAVLDGMELAFSDASGSHWDSNFSRNYPLRCSF